MRFARAIVALAVAVSAPVSVQAEELIYTYWEAGYVGTDVDDLDTNMDGWFVGGSVDVVENVFAWANYRNNEAHVSGFKLVDEAWGVGVGYAWPLMGNLDLVGRAGYAGARAKVENFVDASDDGYSLEAGLRTRLIDRLELEGYVQYVDLSDLGDTTIGKLGAQWYLAPQVAVGVFGAFGEDSTSWGVQLRGTWGRH
jgi:hypothetical protein